MKTNAIFNVKRLLFSLLIAIVLMFAFVGAYLTFGGNQALEANATIDANSYYVVGSMNDWDFNENYQLTRNTGNTTNVEYYMILHFNAGDQFKVKRGEIWYPDGNDYVVSDTGDYFVYFRPNGDGGNDWHYSVIYLAPLSSPRIDFKALVEDEDSTLYSDEGTSTVTVNYRITHNDGINSILLIPTYNSDVFQFTSASVNESALGAATVTDGNGTKKILVERDGAKYQGLDSTTLNSETYFLSVTYTIRNFVAGNYTFGLDTTTTGENNKSEAYYIESGANTGNQTAVAINIVTTSLTMVQKSTATITIGYNQKNASVPADAAKSSYNTEDAYIFEYRGYPIEGTQMASALIENSECLEPSNADRWTVYYTYTDSNGPIVANAGTITEKWYEIGVDNNSPAWVEIDVDTYGRPVLPGYYKVEISATATSVYTASTATRFVQIVPKTVYIDMDDKESAYGEDLVPLTYQDFATGGGFCATDEDYVSVTLTTTADKDTPGEYSITGTATGTNINRYNVIFRRAVNATQGPAVYTVTKKAVTLTANNQTASYTGSEPTVDQTQYTLTGISADGLTIAITKASGVNAGQYTLTPSITAGLNNNFYTVTYVNGTFTITSVGVTSNAIKAYFSGDTVTYDSAEHDLLVVSNSLPSWLNGMYTAENNNQTDADTYTITVSITLDDTTAANYTDGEKYFVYNDISGTISPAAITIKADDKTHAYGNIPVALTYQVTSGTLYSDDDLNVTYTVKDKDNQTVTLSATSAPTAYDISDLQNEIDERHDIVISASNSNYNITTQNGKYLITKGTAVITLTANDSYYNRPLDVTYSVTVGSEITLTAGTDYTVSYTKSEVAVANPTDVGTYTVAISVSGTDNYSATSTNDTFDILAVRLAPVTFTYNHGTATWTAVAADIGKTNSETGVEAASLKEGTTVRYEVYNGESKVAEIAADGTRTFDAAAATTYKVVAIASDSNYLNSETNMAEAYSVSFSEGEHAGTVTGMPATQYIFAGETAVQPSNPVGTGCTFSTWKVNNVVYAFTEAVNANTTVVAIWDEITYTVTFKYLTDSETTSGNNQDVFTYTGLTYGDSITYSTATIVPVRASDEIAISYTFANKWAYNETKYGFTTSEGTATLTGITVTDNMTFVAVFTETRESYTITYYFSNNEATTGYEQVGEAQEVEFGATIEYRTYSGTAYAWFIADYWYLNTARTTSVPATMPHENINVYGTYKFNIGKGDVNASGTVTSDDITLYRQWIVGGYTMIVVESGTEWATVTNANYNSEAVYFLKRVADINTDESKDIRDVSITRMSIVKGYSWIITTGESVTGDAIVRGENVNTVASLTSELSEDGGYVNLYADITNDTADVTIAATGNVYIDLGGKTLTVKSLTITAAKIIIVNGTLDIKDEDGITLTATAGTVTVTDVTAKENNTTVTLPKDNP